MLSRIGDVCDYCRLQKMPACERQVVGGNPQRRARNLLSALPLTAWRKLL